MTIQETVQQLQHTPLSYRIQVIELLLQSLKEEITQSESVQTARKPFRVQPVDLGADVSVDRDEMYGDIAGLYTVNTKDFEQFTFLDVKNPLQQ
jgi:hypothetical protein